MVLFLGIDQSEAYSENVRIGFMFLTLFDTYSLPLSLLHTHTHIHVQKQRQCNLHITRWNINETYNSSEQNKQNNTNIIKMLLNLRKKTTVNLTLTLRWKIQTWYKKISIIWVLKLFINLSNYLHWKRMIL